MEVSSWENHLFLWVIFHSYVKKQEGKSIFVDRLNLNSHGEMTLNHYESLQNRGENRWSFPFLRDTIDTATAYNNLACCLAALDRPVEVQHVMAASVSW